MTAQNAVQIDNPQVNGVNVGHLMNLICGIEQDHDRSKFQFRLKNQWVDGGLNRSRIKEYFADGREDDTRSQPFIVDADEPVVSAGNDSAPNPMEFVLHALASCLTSTMRSNPLSHLCRVTWTCAECWACRTKSERVTTMCASTCGSRARRAPSHLRNWPCSRRCMTSSPIHSLSRSCWKRRKDRLFKNRVLFTRVREMVSGSSNDFVLFHRNVRFLAGNRPS